MGKSAEAFRTIREVADWLGVPTHVLRFWESKFEEITPVKGPGGRRYYRPDTIRLLGGIRVLLHDQGLTIRGAQKMIREDGIAPVMELSPELQFSDDNSLRRARRGANRRQMKEGANAAGTGQGGIYDLDALADEGAEADAPSSADPADPADVPEAPMIEVETPPPPAPEGEVLAFSTAQAPSGDGETAHEQDTDRPLSETTDEQDTGDAAPQFDLRQPDAPPGDVAETSDTEPELEPEMEPAMEPEPDPESTAAEQEAEREEVLVLRDPLAETASPSEVAEPGPGQAPAPDPVPGEEATEEATGPATGDEMLAEHALARAVAAKAAAHRARGTALSVPQKARLGIVTRRLRTLSERIDRELTS